MWNSCDIFSFICSFHPSTNYLHVKCVFNTWYSCVKCTNLWMNKFHMIFIINSSHGKFVMIISYSWLPTKIYHKNLMIWIFFQNMANLGFFFSWKSFVWIKFLFFKLKNENWQKSSPKKTMFGNKWNNFHKCVIWTFELHFWTNKGQNLYWVKTLVIWNMKCVVTCIWSSHEMFFFHCTWDMKMNNLARL
jgi:hypothetical protein